ncbi:Crp/Fnr family transcriptional regulator [Mucilaginibacter sp. X4EP1]|uniref:Crp/Fnr family transcriptional regulator n=1 Tax=Mucilaginibacter sp. X4EP1 TaxID=2723092 RepID=UPI00216AA045|nr:Crp/Fnr family transcriptional regulator [Mucilaginibacter sp. X4EP1]MCS3811499.1 CRP-like cAMP-binding protein [Mucilaginibacter sp. X4EP1]
MKSETLIRLLSEKANLSAKFVEALELCIHTEIYKPHQIIQAAGNIENRLFFIESGFARNYFYDHFGNEHTVRIWEPGDIMFSYEGYYNVASYFYVEIMSQSQFISLSYEKLDELEKEFIEAKLLIRYFLLQFQKRDFEKQQLVSLPAEERYIFLRKNKNHLFSKINSKIIASYLQLSAKTLSRYMSKR